jgi:hypothetical protein
MSLWSNHNDNQQTPNSTVSNAHTRRLTEGSTLSLLRDWLLHDYVSPYCRSLAATRIFRRCYWVDALGNLSNEAHVPVTEPENGAGADKRRKKEPSALQPVVVLARQLAQEQPPIALYGLLLASGGKSKRQKATVSAQVITLPEESGIIAASWFDTAQLVLAELDQSPAIFLLNPFGPTLFSYEILAPLYQRAVPTELLFLLPHRQLLRHFYLAHRKPEQAAVLTALLRSDRWKSLPKHEEESRHVIDGLIELLITSMQRYFPFAVQRLLLPVSPRPALIEMLPYTLLFATRRQDSLLSMNDAICTYRRTTRKKSYRGLLNEEWFAQQQEEQIREQRYIATERILQLGRAQRVRRWPDLRQQVLLSQFGTLTVREYDSLIQQSLAQGIVRCEWRRSTSASTASNHNDNEATTVGVPGNEDTLLWS